MKLRSKIILVATATSSLASALLGTIAATSNWNSSISAIDAKLGVLAKTVCVTPDPLDAALVQLDSVGGESEVAFFSINKDLTVLSDNTTLIKSKPTISQLRLASIRSVTVSPTFGESYQMRTCAMPDKEFVIYASSLKNAKADALQTIEIMTGSTVFLVLWGALTVWFLTRKDLRRIENLIDKAKKISRGELDTKLEPAQGNSELDQLNNALAEMVQSLSAVLNKERNLQTKMKTFIADASHELKTPLTLIRGYSELANTTKNANERNKHLDAVHSQIERMQSLVGDLLLLAQLEEQPELETEQINLSEIVMSSASDYKVLHANRKLKIEVDEDVFVTGSKRLIEQLLANLISNLSRHLEDHNQVSLSLTKKDGWATLQIEDDGPGLPRKAYEEGVQRFQRFDNSRARKTGGTGLGISIMAAIVDSHGGTFELTESSLGGLRSKIGLPLAAKTPKQFN